MMDKRVKRAMIAGAVIGSIDGAIIFWSDGVLSNTFGGTLFSNILWAGVIGVLIGYFGYKWVVS